MTKAVDSMARKKTRKKGDFAVIPGDAEAIIREMAAALREHADFLEDCIGVYEKIGRPSIKVLTGKFYMRLRQIRETFFKQVIGKMQKARTGEFESSHPIYGDLIDRLNVVADRMDALKQRKTGNGK